jgi:hypothetical protein
MLVAASSNNLADGIVASGTFGQALDESRTASREVES